VRGERLGGLLATAVGLGGGLARRVAGSFHGRST
jgi:hypothetical protein